MTRRVDIHIAGAQEGLQNEIAKAWTEAVTGRADEDIDANIDAIGLVVGAKTGTRFIRVERTHAQHLVWMDHSCKKGTYETILHNITEAEIRYEKESKGA